MAEAVCARHSVYSRHCASIDNAEVHVKRMGDQVPSAGEVHFLTITDRQFGRIKVFVGKKRQPNVPSPSPQPKQLLAECSATAAKRRGAQSAA